MWETPRGTTSAQIEKKPAGKRKCLGRGHLVPYRTGDRRSAASPVLWCQLFIRANQRAEKRLRAGDFGLLRRPSGGGKWDARGACRQGATAAGLVHSQARRRAVGEITGLPTQSRSGDGSSGITATTGISVWRARRRVGMPALMGRGGELCGHGLPRGSAIGHRALHGCGGSPGALVGRVGTHRRWPVSICVMSKPTPNLPQSCSARGAPTGPLVGFGGRHERGPLRTHRGNLSPSPTTTHPL